VDRRTGRHLLLDGHLRLLVLRQLGRHEAPCIIATDNESYTYNNRVNRMSTIQEHFMILRAIELVYQENVLRVRWAWTPP